MVQQPALPGDLEIDYVGRTIVVRRDQDLRFGRDPACDIVIDADDTGVSRLAGMFEHDGERWWVVNLSTKRALHVFQAGYGYPIFPAGKDVPHQWPIQHDTRLLVPGRWLTYELDLRATPAPDRKRRKGRKYADARTTDAPVALSDAQRRAIIALCARFLMPADRYEPRINTYAEAAEILSLSPKTVEHHLTDVRALVARHIVLPEERDQLREAVCRYFLANRLIGPGDLRWLRREEPGSDSFGTHAS
jgi:hypothetical protein